jgi:hypothetical protein
MKLKGTSFPETVSSLTGGMPHSRSLAERRANRSATTSRPNRSGPSGLPETDALALVEESVARLWSPEGALARAYLTGPRCLGLETIRAARLGLTPGASIPKRDGDGSFKALGVVIPWFNGDRLALVKIRQLDEWRMKYAEAFRDPDRLVCYPSPATIRPGRPVVVVEGEFDALALGEALGELTAVVTLGSASARPDSSARDPMLAAPRWYVATDRDEAGDRAFDGWPTRARRVRPPSPYNDWTDAKAAGINLARWWRDILTGIDRPPLYSWEELAPWRWGGADEAPGIDNPGWPFNPETFARAMRPEGAP